MTKLAHPLSGVPDSGLPDVALVTFTGPDRREVLRCRAKIAAPTSIEPKAPVPASAVACDILVPGTRFAWYCVPLEVAANGV